MKPTVQVRARAGCDEGGRESWQVRAVSLLCGKLRNESRGPVERPRALLRLHSAPSSLQRPLQTGQERQRGGSSHTPAEAGRTGKEQRMRSACTCLQSGGLLCAHSLPAGLPPSHVPLGPSWPGSNVLSVERVCRAPWARGRAPGGLSTEAAACTQASLRPGERSSPAGRLPPAASAVQHRAPRSAEGGKYNLLAVS